MALRASCRSGSQLLRSLLLFITFASVHAKPIKYTVGNEDPVLQWSPSVCDALPPYICPGQWWLSRSTEYANGTVHTTSGGTDLSVTLKFKGSAIYWYTTKFPGGGTARVTVDSGTPSLISTDQPEAQYSVLVFQQDGLDSSSDHTISISYVSGQYLDVDFFSILSDDSKDEPEEPVTSTVPPPPSDPTSSSSVPISFPSTSNSVRPVTSTSLPSTSSSTPLTSSSTPSTSSSTSPTSVPTRDSSNNDVQDISKLDVGAIAGISIGCTSAVFLVILGALFYIRQRRQGRTIESPMVQQHILAHPAIHGQGPPMHTIQPFQPIPFTPSSAAGSSDLPTSYGQSSVSPPILSKNVPQNIEPPAPRISPEIMDRSVDLVLEPYHDQPPAYHQSQSPYGHFLH